MRLSLIDGNNLAYKCYASFAESRGGLLKNSFGVPTTVVFGMMRTMNYITNKMNFDRSIICWDITGSYYRRKLFPLYKKHRKYKDMQDYFKELDSARKYFEIFGINQGIAKGIEADDLIGYLSKEFSRHDNEVVVISDDKDFYQIVSKKVKLYRPIIDQIINKAFIVGEFGMKPYLLPKIKALTGEDTDFIPGCCDVDEKNMKLIKCKLGEKTAIKLLSGKKNLVDAIDNCTDEKWKPKLQSKRDSILMSYKLAKIRTKKKQYEDWEYPILDVVMKQFYDNREVEAKKVIRVRDDLELKTIDIIQTLKRLGVNVVGKAKQTFSEGKIKI